MEFDNICKYALFFLTLHLSRHPLVVNAVTSGPAVAHPEVTTTYGKVKGQTLAWEGKLFDVYSGIPHAQPPVGSLRFMPPVAPKPWTDVKDTTNNIAMCPQSRTPKPGESEDCLYLDVTTPSSAANSSSPLPVMVYIHGGGWRVGSKQNGEDGKPLASHGVVVVAANYRLGPLGFLSTGDDSIPGNFGMLDQISALKWVQANIAAFGGDPKMVTIFGTSSGGASVSMQVMSPLAKGLFARAIMESSVASTSREVPPPMLPVTLTNVSIATGNRLGCGHTPGVAFRSCLQRQTLTDFMNAARIAANTDPSSGPWRPSIEKVFGFMPDYPLRLRARGEFAHDVDTIRGFCSQEQGGHVSDPENDGLTRAEFRKAAATQLTDFPYLNASEYIGLLEQNYLGNISDPLVIRDKTVQMRSDYTYILPIVTESQQAKRRNRANSNTYMYNFNYRPSWVHVPAWVGVTHVREKPFVWGTFPAAAKTTATDHTVSSALQMMWTNFAKYGDPTPPGHTDTLPIKHWSQTAYQHSPYLVIDGNRFHNARYDDIPENKKHLDFYKKIEEIYLQALDTDPAIVG